MTIKRAAGSQLTIILILIILVCKIQPSYFRQTRSHATRAAVALTEQSSGSSSLESNSDTEAHLLQQQLNKIHLNSYYQFKHSLYNVTIPENSVGKTYARALSQHEDQLMGVAVPPDFAVKYRIITGDRDKLFKAEERLVGDFAFLLIRTRTSNVVLNREKNEEYILKVRASIHNNNWKNISNYEAETTVHLRVLDRNDLSPLFYPTEYAKTIPEDTAVHSAVLKVMAEDADLGMNGEIYYSFLTDSDYFAIHPTTGVITLTRRLRYAEISHYELAVLANDRGSAINHHSHQASKAKVSIDVEQVNLHAPEIYVKTLSSITANVSASTHGIVGIVRISDKDIGRHGEIGKLEIVDGDPDGNFLIKRTESDSEYYIEMNRLAQLRQPPYIYNLTLRAEDKGVPLRFSHKIVPIQIYSESSNAPIFTKELYEVSIAETSPPNMPVIRLKVADHDLAKKAALVSLEIVGGNEGGEFRINPDSGMLYTQKPLDAETKAFYTLTVSAIDQANVGVRKQSSAKVKINVQDMNDNDPVFEQLNSTTLTVNENEPAHTVVARVTAKDRDSGENSYISYSIANLNEVPFEIDHFSGVIRTTQLIDFETAQRNYVLSVRASDWGLPYRRQTELKLKTNLRDVNDNRPQFERVNCVGTVLRSTAIGTDLFTLSAIDFDTGDYITYRLISGNEDGCFNLDSATGVLSTGCDLADVGVSVRTINVSATDGTHFSDEMSINLSLVHADSLAVGYGSFECRETGVARRQAELLASAEKNNANSAHQNELNDLALTPSRYGENVHTPEFVDFPRELPLNESLQLGETVVWIKAKDRDLGYNGKLVFAISDGDYDSVFRIDPDSGELQIIGYLDRERQDEYVLNITVYDLGQPQKSSSKMLPVNILDSNDNPPVFQKSLASFRLLESTPNGTKFHCLNASDADEGRNAAITYSIQGDAGDFRINSTTGCILAGALDRERRAQYELHVIARDGGVPALAAESVITIIVDDVNDNAPVFGVQEFIFKVREDVPRGTVVATIEASDFDAGVNGEVHLALKEELPPGEALFKIDKYSGVIRTLGYLDYETRQVHNLIVSAIDGGNPSLTADMPVIVEVIDVNENRYAPEFDDFVYVGRITENAARGSVVLNVTAKDLDGSGPDAKITYSFRGGNGMGVFAVNDEQGTIHVLSHLDAETKNSYWLTLCAQDQAIVPLSSCVQVYIEVENENDNVPLTEKPVYYQTIPEGSPPGTAVMEIRGFDRDNDPDTKITYKIISGNPEGFFALNSITGLLTTTERKLDRENQAEHILEISVSDNGTPSLHSTTRVVVNVEDMNDHGPEFDQRFYKIQVPSTVAINESIYQVLAFDADIGENGRVSYYIKSGKGKNKFRMDVDTGFIHIVKLLEPDTEYDLTVRADDNGQPKRSQTTRLNIVVVAIVSDATTKNAPPEIKPTSRVDVTESDRPGFLVAHIEAHDADGDQLWYQIQGGDELNEFYIGRDNGNILLSKALDWERKNAYNLSVSVTDGRHVAQTELHVQVIDINDNRPLFTKDTYYVNISESIEEESIIMQLHASDRDEDKKIFYTLHAAEDPASLSLFRIDSMTGNVLVTQRLDYEKSRHHVLIVTAKDQGTPVKRNYAKIVIAIYDHNDHAPEFTSKIIQSRIPETAVIGSKIVQLYALDKDSGKNAEVRYAIITGNVGNTFDIDATLGIVYLAKDLNLNQIQEYMLQIKATDMGEPALSSQMPVHIIVTISENDPPKFASAVSILEIYENLAPGTFVTQVEARASSSVFYEIAAGNDAGFFHINPSTGILLIVQDGIDYETTALKMFNLTISGTSMASVASTHQVVLHIIDVNDNAPYFEQSEYFGEISEASDIGALVVIQNDTKTTSGALVLKARDLDAGINSMIEYSILMNGDDDDEAKTHFKIDSLTGAIKVMQPLDYETVAAYTFHVLAHDLGTPRLYAKRAAVVHVSVRNVNDCPPVFERKELNATIYLPTYDNVIVTTVHATDADRDERTKIQYSILDGNADDCFRIDSTTGVITIRDVARLGETHTLHIRASDGLYSTILQLNVATELANSSDSGGGLVFQKAVYDFAAVENLTKIVNIGLVNVVGNALHEIVVYGIISETSMFTIGPTSGAISTVGRVFDRETRDAYVLVVEAKSQLYDRSRQHYVRRAHALVNVAILDVNDNCPIFVNLPYYATVSTDDVRGSVIAKVRAIDMDALENGEVRYEMKKGNGELFKMDRKTGELSLRQNIEGHNRNYDLIVAAYDGAIVPCSTDVAVHVKVVDKAMPIFDKQFYSVAVKEDVEMFSALALKLKAESPLKREIIYSITRNNAAQSFEIDYKTGALLVVNELDYEAQQVHEIEVSAMDSVLGIHASVIVSINVEDTNDCYPQIESDNYNVTLAENLLPGTLVLKVNATDRDAQANGALSYSLEAIGGQDYAEFFHMDDEGYIYLKNIIDYEQYKALHLLVTVRDHGAPSLSSKANVWITVTDVNDNAPRFTEPSYASQLSMHAVRGQFVCQTKAYDLDDTDNERLLYKIIDGNERQTYAVDERTGCITLQNVLNFTDHHQTLLNVSVTDGVHTCYARVKILLLAENDHSPVFEQAQYEAQVRENDAPPGGVQQHLVTVTAVDYDTGKFAALTYEIASDQMRNYFDVNSTSGAISARVPFDREAQSQYDVIVRATDGGGKFGFATVKVRVLDENDNRPYFSTKEYKSAVSRADVEAKAPILQLNAIDDDASLNGEVRYKIHDNTLNEAYQQLLSIDEATGELYVHSFGDAVANQLVQFFVRATDGGEPPLHSDVPVSLQFIGGGGGGGSGGGDDIDGEEEISVPKFDKSLINLNVLESTPPGTVLTRLRVHSNFTLQFSLATDSKQFRVTESGDFTLLETLDREEQAVHRIGVTAAAATVPVLFAYAEIWLYVQDENDNAPVFDSTLYSAEVAENIEKVTAIMKISATDRDAGSNGDVRYALEHDETAASDVASVFDIDLYTGWISSLTTLDRERRSEYNFNVLATDNGAQQKHVSKVPVVIKILDYNDNAAVFKQAAYTLSVAENARPGTVLTNFLLSDADATRTHNEFFIVSGDKESEFQLSKTGELFVARPLDRERIAAYNLSVLATDGKYVASAQVNISVADVNDNWPYCVRPRYNISIAEGVMPGTILLQVSARDADDNAAERLRYYLTGSHSDHFAIEKETGVLKVAKPIDREVRAKYTLLAHVQDGRQVLQRECVSEILVAVQDINDNPPAFSLSQQPYIVSMPEDTKVKAVVTKVHATDRDFGLNRKISYAIVANESGGPSGDYFSICNATGIVRLMRPLDRESISLHNVTIEAADHGEPPLYARTTLLVNVLDINDNPPVFERSTYHVSVPENSSMKTRLLSVHATSKDIGVNAEIAYYIVGGNEQQKFYIDASGAIYLNKSVDYERTKAYYLTVQAIDGGVPPLSSLASVNVTVLDVNDNQPRFLQNFYRARVREDVALGALVLQVLAADEDSAANSVLSYGIVKGNRLQQFTVEATTGNIRIADTLDRETIANYSLEVRVCDNGEPPLCNFVDVNVLVADANDNAPQFKQPAGGGGNYSVVLQENRALGHTVLAFEISDADEPPNTAPYTFDLRSGNEGGPFRLEQDGTLLTATRFNHKVCESYTLQVRVFDNGTPPLYSDTWVRVKIIEESQFPPQLTPLEITVNSFRDDYAGGYLGRIHASDRDQYDVLAFSLCPVAGEPYANTARLFNISANDGALFAISNLDIGLYRVNVSVTDGKFVSSVLVKVTVELITEEMVNNAVILRFAKTTPEEFILSHRKGFARALRTAMRCRLKDVIVITLQSSSHSNGSATTAAIDVAARPTMPTDGAAANELLRARRRRQSAAAPPSNNLDVVFAVRKQQIIPNAEGYFTVDEIRAGIVNNMDEIEDDTNLVIEEIVGSSCSLANACVHGQCVNRIQLLRKNISSYGTDLIGVVAPAYSQHTECHCRPGYDGKYCAEPVNACASDPCPAQKVCWPAETPLGYQCICPRGYTGNFCESKTGQCQHANCFNVSTAVSFNGKSYAHYKINRYVAKKAIEQQFQYALKVRTVQQTGTLLYASGKVDYNVLEVLNGAVQYRFDLGSGEGVVDVSSVYVADGNWHSIALERTLNSAKLTVDHKHASQGSAPGVNGILNIQSSDIYVGAEVRPHPAILGFEDIQRGFVGCMSDISISLEPLPLYISGGSSIAALKRFTNIEFSCDPASVLVPLGVCGAQPCLNGGQCVDLGVNHYQCNCHVRFMGQACELDLDPCASNPCLYGGHCQYHGPSNYTCVCPLHLSGQRCEYGKFCTPNPCKNGGICEEGDGMPHCLCRGYTGATCAQDVDECDNQPCGNGATCINEAGSFRCICPSYLTGASCGDPLYSNSISTRLKNLPELITGIISGAAIIVVVVVIVLCCVLLRKSAGGSGKTRKTATVKNANKAKKLKNYNEDNLNSLIDKERYASGTPVAATKLSNLEVNQQHRPVSAYTPGGSAHEQHHLLYPGHANFVNNLDILRSYGSAGDELENNVPIEFQKINRNNHHQQLININTSNLLHHDAHNDAPLAVAAAHKHWCDQQGRMKTFSENKLNNGAERKLDYVAGVGLHLATNANALRANANGNGGSSKLSHIEIPNVGGGGSVGAGAEYMAAFNHGQYHWDCSDWVRKSQNPLPDITEVPGAEIADSSTSLHSNESNESKLRTSTYILQNIGNVVDPVRDITTLNEELMSEDSELDVSLQPLNFEYLSSGGGDLPSSTTRLSPLLSKNENEDYKLNTGKVYLRHPDSYLPPFKNPSETDEESGTHAASSSQFRNLCSATPSGDVLRKNLNDLSEETYIFGNVSPKFGSNSDVSVHLCEIEESDLDEFLPNDT